MNENYTLRERMSGAINALSIAPDGKAVVVAGRESKTKKKKIQKLFYKKKDKATFNTL
jgi:hypothetical protein